jgi:hypothetical protein
MEATVPDCAYGGCGTGVLAAVMYATEIPQQQPSQSYQTVTPTQLVEFYRRRGALTTAVTHIAGAFRTCKGMKASSPGLRSNQTDATVQVRTARRRPAVAAPG